MYICSCEDRRQLVPGPICEECVPFTAENTKPGEAFTTKMGMEKIAIMSSEYKDSLFELLDHDGYESLRRVLNLACVQASDGKGKERHATTQGITRPFEEQPICTLGRIYGHGYNCGQAAKKAHEAMELPPTHAKEELLGAINYLAAAYLLLEEREAMNE